MFRSFIFVVVKVVLKLEVCSKELFFKIKKKNRHYFKLLQNCFLIIRKISFLILLKKYYILSKVNTLRKPVESGINL